MRSSPVDRKNEAAKLRTEQIRLARISSSISESRPRQNYGRGGPKRVCRWKPGDFLQSTLDSTVFGEVDTIDEKGWSITLKGRPGKKYSPDIFKRIEKP